ncbi:Integration host factor subunit alpha, partial [Caenorhabditis elegans]
IEKFRGKRRNVTVSSKENEFNKHQA